MSKRKRNSATHSDNLSVTNESTSQQTNETNSFNVPSLIYQLTSAFLNQTNEPKTNDFHGNIKLMDTMLEVSGNRKSFIIKGKREKSHNTKVDKNVNTETEIVNTNPFLTNSNTNLDALAPAIDGTTDKIIFKINNEEDIELNINSKSFKSTKISVETSKGVFEAKMDQKKLNEQKTRIVPMKLKKKESGTTTRL